MKADETVSCNPLCAKCLRHCKQPATVLLVECPRFLPLPFKVERHRFDQLSLFDKKIK
jgi:hypothetical protein